MVRICVGVGRGDPGVQGGGTQEMEEWKAQLGNLWISHMLLPPPPAPTVVAIKCKLKRGLNLERLTSYRLSEVKNYQLCSFSALVPIIQ